MGVGNRPRPLAPGLARWRLSDRRRNDSGKAKRLPRAVCERWRWRARSGDGPAGLPGLRSGDRRRGRAQGRLRSTRSGDAPGLARWHPPDRRRNDTGDAKPPPTGIYDPWGLPRTVCEDRAGYGAGQPADECSAGRACTRPGALAIRGSGALLYYPWKGPVLLWLCVTVATDDCIVIVLVKYCYVLLACL
jgi:hypothetical protein